MSNRRASQVIILAEDRKHDSFIRRYLRRVGYGNHAATSKVSPGGRGAGNDFVIREYANEVKNCRQRNTHTSTILIVVIDVDMSSLQYVANRLAIVLKDAGLPARSDDEPVLLFLPKRNIETWIQALLGEPVDEVTDYKMQHRDFADCHRACDILYDCRVQGKATPEEWPDSLKLGYNEVARLHPA